MWQIAAFRRGAWTRLEPLELPAQPPSSAALRDLARQRLESQSALLHYLDQEARDASSPVNGARDAIELWSKLAADEVRADSLGQGTVVAWEEALALLADRDESGDTRATAATLAWHDHTAVLVPLSGDEQDIVFEYLPEASDEQRIERLRLRYASGPEYTLETVLDWRGYFGRECWIVDGWRTMRQSGMGYIASIRGTTGFVAGMVMRRLTRSQPTLERDPTAGSRRKRMRDLYPQLAAACRDLADISAPITHDHAMVFIHGTVSCGLQGLKDLYATAAPQQVYRYEHDTFRKVDENGAELAELISSRLRAKRLLLVAHSRGGLVARVALDLLAKHNYPSDLQLYTFGAPHAGTPLVAIAGSTLNLVFKLGAEIVGGIPMLGLPVKVFSTLSSSPKLPSGIDIMREDNDTLALLNALAVHGAVFSWGADFPVNGTPSGFGIDIQGALLATLGGFPHDLVVPTASALACGTAQPVLSCSHAQYFLQPVVRDAIEHFFPPTPAPTPPVPQSPPPGGSIKIGDGYVLIGGIRVPRRTTP
jgi:hypothetical protein